ncbi:MAG: hypothetical protein D6736_05445 [Nitrospinota bacterium]|nr:MAG: hypothetical protein D6736_05445 [Nitrospinota bacterium]
MGALSGLRWLLFLNILVGLWLIISGFASSLPEGIRAKIGMLQPKDSPVRWNIIAAGVAVVIFSFIAIL